MRARLDDLHSIGLVRDLPYYQLPASAWTDLRNITLKDNSAQRFRGYGRFLEDLSFTPLSLFPASSRQNETLIVAGQQEVWALIGTDFVNISREGDPYVADSVLGWTGGSLGVVPVINNGFDVPQVWTQPGTTTQLEDLAGWPADVRARVVRPFKSFLVAYDISLSGERVPQMLWWSDITEPGEAPTNWDIADPTNSAGRVELAGTPDYIVDAHPLRDINIIYKENSIWGMQFVGGNAIFRFYRITGDGGLASQNCVAEMPRGHVALSSDDLFFVDGQNAQSLIDKRIRSWLFSNIDPTWFQRCFVVSNWLESEVWLVFPSVGSEFCDTALVWNWRENTFTVRDADGFRAGAPSRLAGGAEEQELETWEDDPDASWREEIGPWVKTSLELITYRLVFAVGDEIGPGPKVVVSGLGDRILGDDTPARVERHALPLRAAPDGPVDFERRKIVTEVWPKVRQKEEQDLEFNVWVGRQNSDYEEIDWVGPFGFKPSRDEKINCRVSGRIISYRMETAQDIFWQLDGVDFVYRVLGRY